MDIPTISYYSESPSGAIIEWNEVDGATIYMVAYGISGVYDSAFTTDKLSVIIEGLEYDMTYNFKVRAYNSNGYSLYSSVVYVTPLAPVFSGFLDIPDTPQIVYPIEVGKNNITVRFSSSVYTNSYRIYYSEASGDFENYLDSSANSLNITYLKEGTNYKMKVVAYGIDGSSESETVYETTLSTPINQTSTGNTNSSTVVLTAETDSIYNFKQTYDSTGRVWQFRSAQERMAYIQARAKNFTSK